MCSRATKLRLFNGCWTFRPTLAYPREPRARRAQTQVSSGALSGVHWVDRTAKGLGQLWIPVSLLEEKWPTPKPLTALHFCSLAKDLQQ